MIRDHFPELQLTAICSSVNEGVEKISTLKPQLVFLDVVMPPFTGFDLLNRINSIDFDVIFTTSYEQYAINAFKVSAVDYLLKPFSVEQLAAAVANSKRKYSSKNRSGILKRFCIMLTKLLMIRLSLRCQLSADILL